MPLQLRFDVNGVTVDTAVMTELGAPTVTGFSPTQAPAGTTITFFGGNYVVGQTVSFGGVNALITSVISDIAGTAVVPALAVTGKIRVTTIQGIGESSADFIVGPLPSGTYAHLAPVYAASPAGLTFSGALGYSLGTTVDTTEPTWAFTVALTDTGNQVTNRTNLQAAINTAASSQTGHTKITAPAAFRYIGRIELPTNNTGFFVGLYPASTGFLPAHVPTVTLTERPKKVNRINNTTHLANMPGGELGFNTDTHMGIAMGNVRKYIIRGWQFRNTGNWQSYSALTMIPDSFSLAGLSSVVSTTPSTVTFNAGTTATSFSNFTMWIMRGAGAGQIVHNCNYDGATKTITRGSGTWTTAPDSTSRYQFYTGNPVSGAVTDPSAFFPEDITFMQCYVHGGAAQNVTRAYYLTGRRVSVCDGFTESLGDVGVDSQDVFIAAGQGPFKYSNCYSSIGGPKENIIIGGTSLVGLADELLPSDVEIRFNVFRFAGYGTHKCSTEIKFGRRVAKEVNDASDQPNAVFGGEFVVKLTDQGGDNTASDTSDISMRLNRANNSSGLFQITSVEFYSGTNLTRNVDAIGNVCMNPISNKGIQIARSVSNIACDWNTVTSAVSATAGGFPRVTFFANAGEPGVFFGPNFKFRNNVLANWEATVWVFNPNGANFTNLVDNMGTGAEISGNLCTTAPSTKFAAQVAVNATYDAIGLTSRVGNNGALLPATPGYQTGPGAKDIGAPCAHVDALMAETV